jgi:hypothetical protein
MLTVISPAKDLDYQTPYPSITPTTPIFTDDTSQLLARCRELTPQDLAELMTLSDKLAGLNVARFQSFQSHYDEHNSVPAIFAFNGDVYQGLAARSLDAETLAYSQQHLRILSGLYGVLRPFDWMQPYRLEMGTKLVNSRGRDLYQFWHDRITQALNEQLEQLAAPALLDLASQEYFKAVQAKHLRAPLVRCHFKDEKNGQYKIISFYAKKARGLMARYVMQQRIDRVEGLKEFQSDGYRYDAASSSATELVFLRHESS